LHWISTLAPACRASPLVKSTFELSLNNVNVCVPKLVKSTRFL
jgi:hypothetical protein